MIEIERFASIPPLERIKIGINIHIFHNIHNMSL